MSKSITEEKYRWIKPILDKEISIKQLSMVCPFNERALKYWLASYRPYGLSGLANKSTRAKSHLKETAIRTKERIIGLRKETHLCAQKLNYKLKKEGIDINTRAIGKIIEELGKHDTADKDYYITANTVLNLAQRAFEIFESFEPQEKRQLLNFVFQNLKLRQKNLEYKLKTPYDTVLLANNCSDLLHILNTFRNLNWKAITEDLKIFNYYPSQQTTI